MRRVFADEFKETTESCSRVVCFGTGKIFAEAVKFLDSLGLASKITLCADNSPKKQGTTINVLGRDVKIVSATELEAENNSSSLIIITCANFSEIIAQLEGSEKLADVKYCCYTVINGVFNERNALNKTIPENIKLTAEPIIPKKIHYCWFGGNPLPDKYKKWMESWHKFCPDYEIIEWNESNYDVTKNLYMKQAYEHRKWGFVPDYARLDIIYNNGGIYLDTDVELIDNLDDMLYQKGFIGFESIKYVNLGSGFGSVKKHPVIKKMMDVYDKISFVNADNTLNLTASPNYQTQVMLSSGLNPNGEYQVIEDMSVFPEKMLNGISYSTLRIKTLPYTKSIHHYDGSWLDSSDKEQTEFFKYCILEERI